jgi:hypothetical protein
VPSCRSEDHEQDSSPMQRSIMSIHDPRVATSLSSLEFPPYSWRARHRRKQEAALLVRETELAAQRAQLQTILSDARHFVVGSIIRASGSGSVAAEQPVQRALDAVWHALRQPEGTEVRWCPPPVTRLQHLRDLTRWNDYEATSTADVSSLLLTAERVVLFSGD